MPTFLLKTEPSEYSFDDLLRDKKTTWAGVSNNTALIHIRSARKGDLAFIYHTGDDKAVVGMAQITCDPYQDPARPGLNDRNQPKFAVFDLKPVERAEKPVTLATIRSDPRFKDFDLLRQSRLSVMPVPPAMEKALRSLAGL